MFLIILLGPHADNAARGGTHFLFAAGDVDAKGQLLHRCRAAKTPLHPTARDQINRGNLFGNTGRMNEFMRHKRDAKAQLDVLGDLRQRAKHHLVAGHMRPVFAEMMLHAPHSVETLLVGKGDLFEVFLVDAALFHALTPGVLARPGLRHIEFIQQAKIHPVSPILVNLETG